MPRCNLDYNFMKKRKLGLKMSRPNFEFWKSHMTFGPKVAIFYQFMHYKCHICVEFFWNVDFRRHEKLLLTTIFQIRKIWFSVKTRILPVFLHHNIIFKYTKIKNNNQKSEKDILTFVIFFSQFWTHTKKICT